MFTRPVPTTRSHRPAVSEFGTSSLATASAAESSSMSLTLRRALRHFGQTSGAQPGNICRAKQASLAQAAIRQANLMRQDRAICLIQRHRAKANQPRLSA